MNRKPKPKPKPEPKPNPNPNLNPNPNPNPRFDVIYLIMPEYVSRKDPPKVQVSNFKLFGGGGKTAPVGDARTSLQRCLADWELPFVRCVACAFCMRLACVWTNTLPGSP